MTATSAAKPRRHGFMDTIRDLGKPKVALMAALGFSSGLPFFLTQGTLGFWLRESGASLVTIGFLTWVGLAYSFKFLWSPIVDRLAIPGLGRFGRRRSWLLLTQVLIGLGLAAMALTGPKAGLVALAASAVFVAFVAATQDIAVDALRIEAAETSDELGSYTGAFQLGYRVAVLISDAFILIAAKFAGWPLAYGLMAAFMAIGVFATLNVPEPKQAERVMEAKKPLWNPVGFVDAIAGPFVAFFRTYGVIALLMLLMIALYRVPEYMMGGMVGPFYSDLHLDKGLIGSVRLTIGLVGSLIGITLGGVLTASMGHIRALIIAGIMQGLVVASFALLAVYGPDPRLFGLVMFFDSVGISAAGVALVVYMSSLTSLGYTATQYAFLSSNYTIAGKMLKGFSGVIVTSIQGHGFSLMGAYAVYFVLCGLFGIPALLMCVWLGALKAGKPASAGLEA
jgi:PAT family beta-lactamase induction signal transducer AmpG